MKLEELQLMDVEQLRTIHDNLGIDYHHRAGKETLIKNILAISAPPVEAPRLGAAPTIQDEKPHTATQELKLKKVPDVSDYPNAEQVKEALIPFMQRGLEIVSLDDNFFHFKRGHREDSGNMKQSLRRIVQCASRLV